jgi:hypothetical protein
VVRAGLQTAVHSAMALKGVVSVGGSGGGVGHRPHRRGWWCDDDADDSKIM